MDSTLLFVVEDAFQLSSIGCTLVPGPSMDSGIDVRPGDALRLELPDGRQMDTQVAGFVSIRRTKPEHRRTVPLTLPKSVQKEQVPPGTRVFLIAKQIT
ncbi:hypothetical protein [Roseateles sp.]|uniref:hypothetical protein n=1 Tax=Roseateles sp. TaxID=1971397 RepID=UPI003BAD2E41